MVVIKFKWLLAGIHIVTKPTHLELGNGSAQSRSTNGKWLESAACRVDNVLSFIHSLTHSTNRKRVDSAFFRRFHFNLISKRIFQRIPSQIPLWELIREIFYYEECVCCFVLPFRMCLCGFVLVDKEVEN